MRTKDDVDLFDETDDTDEEDLIDDKTVFIIKRASSRTIWVTEIDQR